MSARPLVAVVAVAAAMLAHGCGGEDDSGGAARESTTPTPATHASPKRARSRTPKRTRRPARRSRALSRYERRFNRALAQARREAAVEGVDDAIGQEKTELIYEASRRMASISARKLSAIQPPADVARPHRAYAAALRVLGGQVFPAALRAIRRGRLGQAGEVMAGARAKRAQRMLVRARREFDRKGYRLRITRDVVPQS